MSTSPDPDREQADRGFQGKKLALALLGVVAFMAIVAAVIDLAVVPR